MRVVFLGSGAFAIPCFEALLDAGHQVAALVTQPDREKGRGRELAPPPLKPVAERRGVPVLQPRRIREPEAHEALQALRPDIQVVVAYGQILPQAVIDIPPRRTVNVHSSLLPKYRGAAPIHWAIASCERVTGVTTMLIDAGLDTGPTLLARETAIEPTDTTASLEPRLARLGAEVLLDTLDGLAAGRITPAPQDHAQATHARVLEKEDGRLDWTLPASLLDCRIRGFFPWPGAFTALEGRMLKVLRAQALPVAAAADPGTVIEVSSDGLLVAAGQGSALRLIEVQPESRRAMAAAAFAAGTRIQAGARLG
jgi:methionyl-tRNA formyltransferase